PLRAASSRPSAGGAVEPVEPSLARTSPGRTALAPTKPVPPKSLPRNHVVDLSHLYNTTGIYSEGAKYSWSAGLDEEGFAFPAQVLASMKTWDGIPFSLGQANTPNAVTSEIIELPLEKFDGIKMLAVGVNGDQESQGFRVSYMDGTSNSFSQDISDWY